MLRLQRWLTALGLVLLFGIQIAFADIIRQCEINACQNGASCFLASPTAPFAKCDHDEVYFNQRCYRVIRQVANHEIATELCRSKLTPTSPGQLVTIRTALEREFIADLLSDSVAGQSKALSSIGFWTGGRSRVPDGSHNVSDILWHWGNESEPIQHPYWASYEPQFEDSPDRLCVSVDVDSRFQQWKSQSCTDLNYFVCERDALDTEKSDWVMQCQCPPGFAGQYCEIPTTTLPPAFAQHAKCENDGFAFSCPGGHSIVVDFAFYGNQIDRYDDLKLVCPRRASESVASVGAGNCADPGALRALIQHCEGHQYCEVPSIGDLFIHRPCPSAVPVAFEYRMRCLPPNIGEIHCPPDSGLYYKGRCISPVFTGALVYGQARQACGLEGGDLATVWKDAKIEVVKKQRPELGVVSPASARNFWIRTPHFPSADNCSFLTQLDMIPNIGDCFQRMHWICEYPPVSDAVSRRLESILTVPPIGQPPSFPSEFSAEPPAEATTSASTTEPSPTPTTEFPTTLTISDFITFETTIPSTTTSSSTPNKATFRPLDVKEDEEKTTTATELPLALPTLELSTSLSTSPPTLSTSPSTSPPTTSTLPVLPLGEAETTTQNFIERVPAAVAIDLNRFTSEIPVERHGKTHEIRSEQGLSELTAPEANTTLQNSVWCPEVTINCIKFNTTPACAAVEVPCPSVETSGTLQLTCGCTGLWDITPEFMYSVNCTHNWVVQLPKDIADGIDPVNVTTTTIARLQTNIEEGDLLENDLVQIVSTTNDLVIRGHAVVSERTGAGAKSAYATRLARAVGELGDALLSPEAYPFWEKMKQQRRIDTISSLMLYLETSLGALLRFTTGTAQFNYDNWESKVVTQNVDIDAPMASPARSRFVLPTGASHVQQPTLSSMSVSFNNVSFAPEMSLPNLGLLSAIHNEQSIMQDSSRFRFMPTVMFPNQSTAVATATTTTTDDSTILGTFMYNSIGNLLSPNDSTIINSRVIGAFVNDPSTSLQLPSAAPVNFTFFHLKTKGVHSPRCVYWDQKNNEWSEQGCVLIETRRAYTKCQCNHLTSFAILMDIGGDLDILGGNNAVALDWFTVFGCSISIVCLSLTILVFTTFKSLYSVRHMIHCNLCICLLVAELLFVLGIDRPNPFVVCRGVAIAMHYFFLAAFFWMLLEGYQLYMMLIRVFEPDRSRIYLHYLIGYGVPAIVVGISAGTSWRTYGTMAYCWINVRSNTIWAFVVPVIVVIATNIVVLLIALRAVLSVKFRDRSTPRKVFGWLKGSCTLLCLLGITWVFGFFTVIPGTTSVVFAYLFCIFNCFQGLFIFVLHVVLNDKVRIAFMRALRSQICCLAAEPRGSSGFPPTMTTSGNQGFFSQQRLARFFHTSEDRFASGTETTDVKSAPGPPTDDPAAPTVVIDTGTDADANAGYDRNRTPSVRSLSPPHHCPPPPPTDLVVSDGDGMTLWRTRITVSDDPTPPSRRASRNIPVQRKKFPLGATDEERVADRNKVRVHYQLRPGEL